MPHKEAKIVEGYQMGDHERMCIMHTTEEEYTVSNAVGYMKGKSVIHIARKFGGR